VSKKTGYYQLKLPNKLPNKKGRIIKNEQICDEWNLHNPENKATDDAKQKETSLHSRSEILNLNKF